MDRSVFLKTVPSEEGVISFNLPISIRFEVVGNEAIINANKKIRKFSIDLHKPLKEQLCEAIDRPPSDYYLVEAPFSVNQYYHRIHRSTFNDNSKLFLRNHSHSGTPSNKDENMYGSLIQLTLMTKSLKNLFIVISPEKENLNTYGHEIRNLLLVACTEVESQWKGILKANGNKKKHMTTKDYVKLLPCLKLNEYSVELPMYPKFDKRIPFLSWDSNSPTKSIAWYDAYNCVKHDRESDFNKANLKNAIDALIACAILFHAQYGFVKQWNEQIGSFFDFTNLPHWEDFECYTKEGYSEENWLRINYPFR